MSARNRKPFPRGRACVASCGFQYAEVCNRPLHFRNGKEAESLDIVEVRKVTFDSWEVGVVTHNLCHQHSQNPRTFRLLGTLETV